MVSIDTVYQKVLSLCNKEQRGYITPQEFNLMADKAQLEIFDSYFHDFKTTDLKPKSNLTYSDDTEILQEKLHPFLTSTSINQLAGNATVSLPTDLYLIDTILKDGIEVTELTKKEIAYTENHPLTQATSSRPIYVRESATFTNNVGDEVITLYPTPDVVTTYNIHYFAKPTTPNWTYVVVTGKALYNSSDPDLQNFQLHPSEEEVLVSKILALAGVIIMKPEVVQYGGGMEGAISQSKND
tara:strand:- start:272 stop:994 length:723 start_codon:yes stop_codon:yes gene_type:complete